MKKQILIAVSVCLLSVTLFVKCTKESQELSSTTQLKIPEPKVNIPVDNYNAPSGTDCILLPGYTSCTSNCLFTECCITWNPRLETGGCSCTFGFSRCSTSPISQSANVQNSESAGTRTILIHQDKIKDFFDFLKTNDIEAGKLRGSYERHLLGNVIEGNSSKARVDSKAYDLFFSDYENFISRLSKTQKALLSQYVEHTN